MGRGFVYRLMWFPPKTAFPRLQDVDEAARTFTASVQDMNVDHRGCDALVVEQFLYRSDVIRATYR